jgi:hypothetical protein
MQAVTYAECHLRAPNAKCRYAESCGTPNNDFKRFLNSFCQYQEIRISLILSPTKAIIIKFENVLFHPGSKVVKQLTHYPKQGGGIRPLAPGEIKRA